MNSLLQDWGVTEELSEGKRMRVDLIRVTTFNMIGSCINRRVVRGLCPNKSQEYQNPGIGQVYIEKGKDRCEDQKVELLGFRVG